MNLSFFNRSVSSIHAAALILGGAAFFAKILGLFRDRLLAARFGAGETLDVYYAAFQIPDLLFTLFLVGAASAAVLPVFLEYDRKSKEAAEDFLSNLLTVFSAGALAVVTAAIVFAPRLIVLVAPGFGAEKAALASDLTRLILANAIFLGLAGIISAALQARHRFFVFALPPILYNVGIIIGIVALVPLLGVRGLAYGVLLGGLLQVIVQLPALFGMGFRVRPVFRLGDPGLRKVFRTSFPRILALSMNQLTILGLGAIASFFAAGSISVFRFATNLFFVPVSLFGVSYALAMFPKLSVAFLEQRGEQFREQVRLGIRTILFWALPLAALTIVLRAHLVRVILGSGAFDWEDTRLVAASLALLAVAIVSESLLPLVLRAFYALGKTREPLFWDIIGSLTTIASALFLGLLFSSRPGFLAGVAEVLRIGDIAEPKILVLALAFAVGSLVNIALLLLSLRRASRKYLGVDLSYEGGTFVTMFVAAALAGGAAYVTLLPFPVLIATNTFFGILVQGAAAGAVGFVVYGVVLWWQKNPEILGLVESFERHLLNLRKTPQVFETEKLDGDSR